MEFKVRLVHPQQLRLREDTHEARDETSLRDQLHEQGFVVLQVTPTGPDIRPAMQRPRTDYPVFCREVRTLVRAGMTVVEAVDTLATRAGWQSRDTTLADLLHRRLQQGESLSQALALLPDAPAMLVAVMRAGERTSDLAAALDDYLRFDDLVQRLRRQVISAATYPSLVTALGVAVTLFLLLVVMPGLARMDQSLRARSGGLTSWTLDLSTWINHHRSLTAMALCAACALLVMWVRSGMAARAFARSALSIPALQSRVLDFQLAMLYQALAVLLKGGCPMAEALQIGGSAAMGQPLRNALHRARRMVEEGSPVSQALYAAGLCDDVDHRLMAAGERNRDFPLAASVVADLHTERFELFIERMTRIAAALLILGVALLVGSAVVAMYLTVFGVATRMR